MSEAIGILTARVDSSLRHAASASGVAIREVASRSPPPEFVRLFHAVNALNDSDKPFLLQFLSSERKEGTSTVASAFAAIAARECAKPVLLLDCSPAADGEPTPRAAIPTLAAEFRDSGTASASCEQPQSVPGLRLARLSNSTAGALNMSPAEMKNLCDMLRKNFAMVVLDCRPTRTCPSSLALARYCDGTAIIVRAERTPRAAVAETKRTVERFGGQVVGVVLNRRQGYIPAWLQRRL